MKNLAYWTGLRIFRDKKIRILLLLFFTFFASFSLIYRQQNLTFPYYEMSAEYEDEQQIYRLIPQQHFEGELGQEVQQRMGSNSTALGTQRFILKEQDGNEFEGLDLMPSYTEVGSELAENNLFLHGATEFESYDLLINEYLPPIEEVEEEARFFEDLESSGLDVEWNYFSAAQVIKAEVELIAGILLFFFIALLASDHFTKDHTNHWSVTHGVPRSWKTEWRLRSLYLFSSFWVVTLGGLAVSYLIGTIIDAPGSLNYPSALYLESGVHYVPMWQYFIIVILLTMLLSYVLLLLTTGLSWFIRNSYLTILLVSGVYVIPQIWQYIPALSSWQPSLYLNIMGVINGATAQNTGLSGVVWWKAVIVFLLLIILLEWLFKFVFSRIPTETAGLKRRVLT